LPHIRFHEGVPLSTSQQSAPPISEQSVPPVSLQSAPPFRNHAHTLCAKPNKPFNISRAHQLQNPAQYHSQFCQSVGQVVYLCSEVMKVSGHGGCVFSATPKNHRFYSFTKLVFLFFPNH
jgi:hypothetical protein